MRQVDGGEDAVTRDPTDDNPTEHKGGHRNQAAEAGDAPTLPGLSHVGAGEDGIAHDPRDLVPGSRCVPNGRLVPGGRCLPGVRCAFLVGTCGGEGICDRSTHDHSVHSPEDVFHCRESHGEYDLAK